MRKGAMIAAAVVIGMTAVTGCSVDGQATRGPVDLDTGSYLSKQSSALTEATSDVAWATLRAIRLADHVVFPRDVDPALVSVKFPLQPLADARNVGGVFGSGAISELPVMQQFQYGYVVSAGADDVDEGFSHAVLSFDSPESAARAADDISKEMLAKKPDEYTADIRTERVSGAPEGTRIVKYDGVYKGETKSHTVMGFLPVGSLLVYSWGDAEQEPRADSIVVSALTKQKALLEPAPTISDDRNPDPTGLMRGTLVGEGGGDPLERSVYSARGAALQFDDQPGAYAAMKDAGVTAVAVEGTQAYRTAGDDQAKTLADYLRRSYADSYTATKKAASPRDLPAAQCWSNTPGLREQHGCTVVVGRFVGYTLSSTLKDAQQQISAQSVFLAKL